MVLSLTSNLSAILGAEIQMRASLLLVVLIVMRSSGWTAQEKSRAPEGGGFLVGAEDVEGVLRRKTAPGSLRARDSEG
jgi:hypothetical protein